MAAQAMTCLPRRRTGAESRPRRAADGPRRRQVPGTRLSRCVTDHQANRSRQSFRSPNICSSVELAGIEPPRSDHPILRVLGPARDWPCAESVGHTLSVGYGCLPPQRARAPARGVSSLGSHEYHICPWREGHTAVSGRANTPRPVGSRTVLTGRPVGRIRLIESCQQACVGLARVVCRSGPARPACCGARWMSRSWALAR